MAGTAPAEPKPPATTAERRLGLYRLYHEIWTCGGCGREFGDCTSCVAHEQQCGGRLERW